MARIAVVDVRGMPAWLHFKARRHLTLFAASSARFGVLLEDVVAPRECLLARTTFLRYDGFACDELGSSEQQCAALTRDARNLGSDADACDRLIRQMTGAASLPKQLVWLTLMTVEACDEALVWDALVHIDKLVTPALAAAEATGWSVVVTASTVRARTAYQPLSFVCVYPARGLSAASPPPCGNLTHCFWNVVSGLCGVPMDLPEHADCAITRCVDGAALCDDPDVHASHAASMWMRSQQPRPDRLNDFSVVLRFSASSLVTDDEEMMSEPALFAALGTRVKRAYRVEVYDLGEDRDETRDLFAALDSRMRRVVDEEVVVRLLAEPVVGVRPDDWLSAARAPRCVCEQLPEALPPVCTLLLPARARAAPQTMPVFVGVIADTTRSVDAIAPKRGASAAVRYEGGAQCVAGWRLTAAPRRATTRAPGTTVHVILVEREEQRGAPIAPRVVHERRRPR
jgi:hypothetical protein